MEGYFEKENHENESGESVGRLNVEVKNLPEFQRLLKQAKEEADQLQKTINQLSNFYLHIDFSVSESTFSES